MHQFSRSNQVLPAPLTSVVVGSSNGLNRQAGPMSEGTASTPGTALAAAPGPMAPTNMQNKNGSAPSTPYDLAGSNPRSSVSQYVAASAAPLPPAAPGLPDEDPDAPTLKPSADGTIDFDQLAPGNYIPFRYPVVRDMIVDSHPEVFRDPETRKKFHKFCQWLTLRNQIRLTCMFDDVYDVYSFIDPDNDDDPIKDPELKEGYMAKFQHLFRKVLDKGDFDLMSEEFLQLAYATETHGSGFMGTGLEVKPVDTDVIEYKIWYRGNEKEKVEWRTWRTLYRKKSMMVHRFDRLVMLYRRRPQEHIDYLQALHPKHWWTIAWEAVFNWMFNIKELSPTKLHPGYLHLKVFKDVANTDVDMLLPGAMAKFSWLDYIIIWLGIAVAIGTATYKAVQGTLRFETMTQILTSVVLIAMPLYGAFRGYMSIKQKIQDLQDHLNCLFITHNLSNNTGCIAQVLDEAGEQEDKEALLAYFFLWRGMKQPQLTNKADLDHAVEAFLQEHLPKEEGITKVDFEVLDAVDKLHRMGILEEVDQPSGQPMYRVVPLDQALDLANINKFDESKEVYGNKPRKTATANGGAAGGAGGDGAGKAGAADAVVWRECEGSIAATGQRFRFFYNVDTGESSYDEPAVYLPIGTGNNGKKPNPPNPPAR